MDSSQLLSITTFTYLFASFLYIAALLFRSNKIGAFATGFTVIALLIQTVGIGLRWIESYQMGIGARGYSSIRSRCALSSRSSGRSGTRRVFPSST